MNTYLFASVENIWLLTGWTMIHFLWLGTLVALAALVSRWLLRRTSANVRYATSLTFLALLAALPIIIATWLHQNPASFKGKARGGFVGIGEQIRDTTLSKTAPIDLAALEPRQNAEAPILAGSPTAIARTPEVSPAAPTIATAASDPLALAISTLNTFVQYLPWLWLIGTPITFALTATGLIGTRRLRRASRPITDGPIAESLEKLAASLRLTRRVAVAVCDRIAAPVLIGILRPIILLPPAALTGYSPDEIEMVLLHELAHVRRWDNLVNLLQRIIESFLFFHPAVWLISSWVRRERETCCDALVVTRTQHPHAYAELLVALAAQMPRSVLFHAAASSAMAAGPLRSRIRRILKLDDDPMLISGKSFAAVLAALLLAATLAVVYVPSIGQAEQSTTESEETTKRDPSIPESVSQDRVHQAETQNNLKNLAIALLNYNDSHKVLPPHASYDPSGKPLLSWRVLILPYLQQVLDKESHLDELYKEFHLNEPWDSEHNRKLIARMPNVFKNPKLNQADTTNYLAVVGKECVFNGSPHGFRIASITDGTAQTIAIVEADQSIEWTKPQDWSFDRQHPTADLGSLWKDHWYTAFVDGSIRRFSSSKSADAVGIHFTRAGGEIHSLQESANRTVSEGAGPVPGAPGDGDGEIPVGDRRGKFPSLEDQRLADLAYKRLKLELEPVGEEDLKRVKALDYDGGLKVVAGSAGIQGASELIQAGDMLVGLHAWPTATMKDLSQILNRNDLAELNPLKFYVVRKEMIGEKSPGGGGKAPEFIMGDVVHTGRVNVNLYGDGFGGGDKNAAPAPSDPFKPKPQAAEPGDDPKIEYLSRQVEMAYLAKMQAVAKRQEAKGEDEVQAAHRKLVEADREFEGLKRQLERLKRSADANQKSAAEKIDAALKAKQEASAQKMDSAAANHDVFAETAKHELGKSDRQLEQAKQEFERAKRELEQAKQQQKPAGKSEPQSTNPPAAPNSQIPDAPSTSPTLNTQPVQPATPSPGTKVAAPVGITIIPNTAYVKTSDGHVASAGSDSPAPTASRSREKITPAESVLVAYDIPADLKDKALQYFQKSDVRSMSDDRGRYIVQATQAWHDNFAAMLKDTPRWSDSEAAKSRAHAPVVMNETGDGNVLLWRSVGLSFKPNTEPRSYSKVSQTGIAVAAVVPGSPAAWADIRPGDILTEVGSFRAGTMPEVQSLLKALAEGLQSKKGVRVTFVRQTSGGTYFITADFTLGPEDLGAKPAEPQKPKPPVGTKAGPAAVDKANFHYEGKTFATWRSAWQSELSTEKRVEAVKALATFGANGYGSEAAASILDVADQYDWVAVVRLDQSTTFEPEGKLQRAIFGVLIGAPGAVRIEPKVWLPLLRKRYEADLAKWQNAAILLLSELSRKTDTQNDDVRAMLLMLTQSTNEHIASQAYDALARRYPDNEELTKRLTKMFQDKAHWISAVRWLGWTPQYPPEVVDLLLHGDRKQQADARNTFKDIPATPAKKALVATMIAILKDDSKSADHIAVIRTLAALGMPPSGSFNNTEAPQVLMEIVKKGPLEKQVAAAFALRYSTEPISLLATYARDAEGKSLDQAAVRSLVEKEISVFNGKGP